MKSIFRSLVLALALCAGHLETHAADGIETRNVTFAKGKSSARIEASIKGDRTIDYVLRAKAGQTMKVEMKSRNRSAYFNVLPPGSNDVAIFVGSTSGDSFGDRLPADGAYRIRVYLMRNAARRGETAKFTLNVSITGG